MENSYLSLKKDFEKVKFPLMFMFIVIFIITIVGSIIYSIWGIKQVNYKNDDYRAQKLMWSTQGALYDYFSKNKTYPDDLQTIYIQSEEGGFNFVNLNEIDFIGYKIQYHKVSNDNYNLETILKQTNRKYILYPL